MDIAYLHVDSFVMMIRRVFLSVIFLIVFVLTIPNLDFNVVHLSGNVKTIKYCVGRKTDAYLPFFCVMDIQTALIYQMKLDHFVIVSITRNIALLLLHSFVARDCCYIPFVT